VSAARSASAFSCLAAIALGCGDTSSPGNNTGTGGTEGEQGGAPGSIPDSSAGCDESALTLYPNGTTIGSINSPTERSFRVHVPPSYKPGAPAPLVLLFHGGGGSGDQFQNRSSRMDVIADREGFITVYPEGTGTLATWNGGICCGRAVQDDVDDISFVRSLLDHLESTLCIDRKRVFSTGMSNGAILSHRLACELLDRISAIAPVAGTIGVSSCEPNRPVAVMQIHGTADGHVPWEGGVGCGPSATSFVSVPDSMAQWRIRNQCDSTSTVTFSQGNGQCSQYDGCAASVALCTIDGGGHSWPGGAPSADVVDCPADGPQSQSFLASEAIWRFFSENGRP
jgi:polyhydroxybutyrate depolymerase